MLRGALRLSNLDLYELNVRPLRVLFVSHFFPPEELSMALLVHELADATAARGHEVHVLTGYPNWPAGKPMPPYSAWRRTSEQMGDVTVHRVPFLASPNGPLWRRLLDFKSFELSVRILGRRLARPDLIHVHVPPNEDALAAAALARHFGCPFVLHVQDVQPDGAIEIGSLRSPLAIGVFRRQENRLYERAAHVVTLGNALRGRILQKGVAATKVSLLPNWIDAQALAPMDRMNPLRAEWGIPADRFVALYAGTFGRVHGTSQLLDAAEQLRTDTQVTFLLVGQGHDFEQNRQLVQSRDLQNVIVKEFVPRARLRELQAIADVSLVTLRPGLGSISVPSKVLGYMAAGRPVIGLVDSCSDTAALLRDAGCGIVLGPGDVVGLARELRALAGDPSLGHEWGRRGRNYVLDNLDTRVVLERGVAMIEGVARRQAICQW